tara:strand:+ start:1977 stop:2810 length:834 start_codon:yes stop_codon:yes gene_type:complete
MKLISKIEYRKDIPATEEGCINNPYGSSFQEDNTPGLSWEGIGRELRRNSWDSANSAHPLGDDDGQLSMKKMIDGDEFTPDQYIRSWYGPHPSGYSYAASEFFDYNHHNPPPPVPEVEPDSHTPYNPPITPPSPPPVPPAPVPSPTPTYTYDPLAGMSGAWAGLDFSNFNFGSFGIPGLSDKRLKTNIKKVGKSPSGINIYEFNFKHDLSRKFRGVIADELIIDNPSVVSSSKMYNKKNKRHEEYLTVNYNKIDVEFKQIGNTKKNKHAHRFRGFRR